MRMSSSTMKLGMILIFGLSLGISCVEVPYLNEPELIDFSSEGSNLALNLKHEKSKLAQIIDSKVEGSCIIKVLSMYMNDDEMKFRDARLSQLSNEVRSDKEDFFKVIAIELTKCLFHDPSEHSDLFDNCFPLEWTRAEISVCLKCMMHRNQIYWITFIGYLNKIDQIIDNRFENVDNIRILNEYKSIIENFELFLESMKYEQSKLNHEFFKQFQTKYDNKIRQLLQGFQFQLNEKLADLVNGAMKELKKQDQQSSHKTDDEQEFIDATFARRLDSNLAIDIIVKLFQMVSIFLKSRYSVLVVLILVAVRATPMTPFPPVELLKLHLAMIENELLERFIAFILGCILWKSIYWYFVNI